MPRSSFLSNEKSCWRFVFLSILERKFLRVTMRPRWKKFFQEYEPQEAKRRVFMSLKRLNEVFSVKRKKVSYVCYMHALSILYEWVKFAKKETKVSALETSKHVIVKNMWLQSECTSIIVRSMCSSKQVAMLFSWYIMRWLLKVHIEHIGDSASHVMFRVAWHVSKSLACHDHWK